MHCDTCLYDRVLRMFCTYVAIDSSMRRVLNTWMLEQNSCHFADDISKWVFLSEIIFIEIS